MAALPRASQPSKQSRLSLAPDLQLQHAMRTQLFWLMAEFRPFKGAGHTLQQGPSSRQVVVAV
jgi:hypothetical protein